MTARNLLAAALVVVATGCAGASRQSERLRERLDAYTIDRPLSAAWPEALRYVSDRGYGLVGEDRKLVGLGEQSLWSQALSKGYATRVAGRQWRAETSANPRGQRYRVEGTEVTSSSCRIVFYAISDGDPFRRGEIDANPGEYRDPEMQLAFIESLDADAAAKIARAARAD